MLPNKNHFANVALLITVYNRTSSLERLLNGFASLDVSFGEVVVSDDASPEPHLTKLKKLEKKYRFKLVSAQKNSGLGNNINKGQRVVSKPFTLYVQEDFVPRPAFVESFRNACDILISDQHVDTIRFYGYFPYPFKKPYGKGFDEMIFEPSLFKWSHLKFYVYSDHPHLRRSDFLEKFGSYVEGTGPGYSDYTEFQMCLAFIKNKGKGLITTTITDVFDQKNSSDEPSTMNRESWKESPNVVVRLMRQVYLVYRYLKNNVQLYFLK